MPKKWREELEGLLKAMADADPDVEASAIVRTDGLVMAAALPKDADEGLIAAMSAALLNIGKGHCERDQGRHHNEGRRFRGGALGHHEARGEHGTRPRRDGENSRKNRRRTTINVKRKVQNNFFSLPLLFYDYHILGRWFSENPRLCVWGLFRVLFGSVV